MKTFCPGPPGRGDAIARGRIFHDDFEQRAFFMPLPSCQRRALGKDRVFPLVNYKEQLSYPGKHYFGSHFAHNVLIWPPDQSSAWFLKAPCLGSLLFLCVHPF